MQKSVRADSLISAMESYRLRSSDVTRYVSYLSDDFNIDRFGTQFLLLFVFETSWILLVSWMFGIPVFYVLFHAFCRTVIRLAYFVVVKCYNFERRTTGVSTCQVL